MKRKFILFLIIASLFLMTGCGNNSDDTNENNNKNNIEENGEQGGNSSSSDDIVDLYSDNTKYVFEFSNTKYVFYYSGEEITGYETYVKYEDAATANFAYNLYKQDENENVKNAYVKGKYLVFEWDKNEYEDWTTSEIKATYSYMKEIKQGSN